VTTVAELRLASSAEPWRRLGLAVDGGSATIGSVRLAFVEPDDATGVTGWGLAGLPEPTDSIDGLATWPAEPSAPAAASAHPLGIAGWDHLVVMTSSLERTCRALEAATGVPLKRIREAGAIRQGFHRFGELIVEVVESPQVTASTASFWGFVWNVDDLHEVCDRLGPEVIGLPKPAVQPGRFIATVRADLGLGVPLALMTPGR
jgi:hypothetical protein